MIFAIVCSIVRPSILIVLSRVKLSFFSVEITLFVDGSYIESNILSFYVCGNKTFLAGINGKCIIKYN